VKGRRGEGNVARLLPLPACGEKFQRRFPENSEFNRQFSDIFADLLSFWWGRGRFAAQYQGATNASLFGAEQGIFRAEQGIIEPHREFPCEGKIGYGAAFDAPRIPRPGEVLVGNDAHSSASVRWHHRGPASACGGRVAAPGASVAPDGAPAALFSSSLLSFCSSSPRRSKYATRRAASV
jgi:hypothetical protein